MLSHSTINRLQNTSEVHKDLQLTFFLTIESVHTDGLALTADTIHAVYRFYDHKAGAEGPTRKLLEICALMCRPMSSIYYRLIAFIVYWQVFDSTIGLFSGFENHPLNQCEQSSFYQ